MYKEDEAQGLILALRHENDALVELLRQAGALLDRLDDSLGERRAQSYRAVVDTERELVALRRVSDRVRAAVNKTPKPETLS